MNKIEVFFFLIRMNKIEVSNELYKVISLDYQNEPNTSLKTVRLHAAIRSPRLPPYLNTPEE